MAREHAAKPKVSEFVAFLGPIFSHDGGLDV